MHTARMAFFLFLHISGGSFEEERRSENASWLYVFKFIPFHLLITYIPFKVAGPGYAAFFLSPATVKRWGAHYLHARPAPGSAEGRAAAFPECPLCAASYMGIISSHHGNKHIRSMPLPPFCRRRTCSHTESATALGFEPSSAPSPARVSQLTEGAGAQGLPSPSTHICFLRFSSFLSSSR